MSQSASEFLRQPCSCQGSNETCYKCGGWGYIDKISEGRSAPAAHGGGIGRNPSFSTQRKKRVSQSSPEPSNKTKLILVKPMSLKFGPPTTICPLCGVGVRMTRLTRHISKVHSETAIAQPLAAPAKPTSKRQLCKCPFCASLVRQDRLDAHIQKIHKAATKASPQVSIRRKLQSTMHQQSASETNSCLQDRSMDATRDYYIRYRDNGQFGSYPSHDSFDDESEP